MGVRPSKAVVRFTRLLWHSHDLLVSSSSTCRWKENTNLVPLPQWAAGNIKICKGSFYSISCASAEEKREERWHKHWKWHAHWTPLHLDRAVKQQQSAKRSLKQSDDSNDTICQELKPWDSRQFVTFSGRKKFQDALKMTFMAMIVVKHLLLCLFRDNSAVCGQREITSEFPIVDSTQYTSGTLINSPYKCCDFMPLLIQFYFRNNS